MGDSSSSAGAKPVRQISDVTKPGKSAPSSSSKPIIVTNRPVLKDPMMRDETASNDAPASLTQPGHLTLTPISETAAETKDTKDEKLKDDKDDKNSKEDKITTASTADDTTEATEAPADEPAAEEPKADTATADTDTTDKPAASPTDDKPAELDAVTDQRKAELQSLADSHKYYLPINQVEQRRAKQYAWAGLLLIILLAVAWADIAADAGLITLPGVKPVTHFFSK